MSDAGVNILTYHSISDAPGPTSIPSDIFRAQMDALDQCGYSVISLAEFVDWHGGKKEINPRSAVITFDDGFADFADLAAPIIQSKGWSAITFLPTGCIGGHDSWEGEGVPLRPLMSWQQITDLAEAGIEFGSHTVNHVDLTTLKSEQLQKELSASREQIAERLGKPTRFFAPPYGRSNTLVRSEIEKYYSASVGVRLQRATPRSDLFDLPRIEMHYFRDLRRWRAYLEGRGEGYFALRRGMRRLRELVRS